MGQFRQKAGALLEGGGKGAVQPPPNGRKCECLRLQILKYTGQNLKSVLLNMSGVHVKSRNIGFWMNICYLHGKILYPSLPPTSPQ